MKYKCQNCGKEMELDLNTARKIICQFCGFRILEKTRPKVVKKIGAV